MPSNYKRKSSRQSWSEDDMQKAVDEVLNKRMGCPRASKTFKVPQSTLERRVQKAKNGVSIEEASAKGLGHHKPVFSADQEKELVSFILEMESRFFGLTLLECRQLAYELAEKNNIPHNFNKERKMAGKDWLYGFLRRNPNVKLRSLEATSHARAIASNNTAVGKFIDLLSGLYDKHNFPTERINNLDETGITTVPQKQSDALP